VSTSLADPAFIAYSPAFEEVAGDGARLSLLAEVDAHEGPVYFADENALYFTSLPRPGPDRSPAVQIKRLPLDEPDRVSVLVEEANGANGMTADLAGNLIVCEQGSRWQPARISRVDRSAGEREMVVDHWRGLPFNSPTTWSSRPTARSGSPTRPTATSRASGTATVVTGGEMVGSRSVGDGEVRAESVTGGARARAVGGRRASGSGRRRASVHPRVGSVPVL
jgi:sugar lactone lactonase YvrE